MSGFFTFTFGISHRWRKERGACSKNKSTQQIPKTASDPGGFFSPSHLPHPGTDAKHDPNTVDVSNRTQDISPELSMPKNTDDLRIRELKELTPP